MKVEKTLRRLETDDREALAQAARDVGHELPRKRLSQLAELRCGLAALQQRSGDRNLYSSGYRSALLDVLAAFDAAVSPRLRADELVRIVRSRKWWSDVVVSLASGPARPSDLATALTADPAAISRVLSELRGLGLVEYAELGEKGDARSRPHRLTLAGESIVDRLGGSAILEKTALEPVLRTAVSLFTQLAIDDRVSLSSTEPTMRRMLGPSSRTVSSVLDKVLREFDLHHRSWAQEVFLVALEGIVTGERSSFHLQSALQRVARTGAAVYVRCARTQQPLWDRIISVPGLLPFGSRSIGPADIDAGDVPKPKDSNVSVVYDCLPILRADLETEPEMKSLVEAANWRFCVGPRGTNLPGGFELLSVDAEKP